MANAKTDSVKDKGGKKLLKNALIALIVLGAIAGAVFFYLQYKKAQDEVARLSNPQEAAQEEAKKLREQVAQIYDVPDEVPTIATVVDANKLKEQPFFTKAENQDRVLIFTSAKRAILYRPSTKKIIEVAPINIGEGSAANQRQENSQ